MSRISRSPTSTDPAKFKAHLSWQGGTLSIDTLIDSGADESLIDHQLASQANIPLIALTEPIPAFALDGHKIGLITHRTQLLKMTLSGNHVEEIHFHVLPSPGTPLILGRPWSA